GQQVVHADRWRCAATPVVESIAYRDEIGRDEVDSRESLVALGRGKLQNRILHRENGVATGDLPLAVRPDAREGVAYLDGAENAAGGAQHDRRIVLDRTFVRRSAQLGTSDVGRFLGQVEKHVQPVRTQVT